MSISLSAFNAILQEFMSDLAETFPEIKSLSEGRDMLRGLCSMDANNRTPQVTFMEIFGAHSNEINGKDPSLFMKCKIPFVEGDDFNMAAIWAELEEDNKTAIWNYLHQLLLLGSTIDSVTPEMLAAIEGVAQSCIDKVNSGEMSSSDAQNPLAVMQACAGNEALMQSLFSKK